MKPIPQLSDSDLRALRARVFNHSITELEWQSVRHKWARPESTAWLLAHDFPLEETLQRKEATNRP